MRTYPLLCQAQLSNAEYQEGWGEPGVRCPKEMGLGNNLEMIKGYFFEKQQIAYALFLLGHEGEDHKYSQRV